MRRFLMLNLLFATTWVWADTVPDADTAAPPALEQPELPAPVQSGEQMPPDITIIRKGNETIQEFRRSGKLYMVKVKPDVGPAYYLIDKNGDGVMDVKRSDLDKNTDINQWLLMEWN